MLIWIAMAVLAAAAAVPVLAPLYRARQTPDPASAHAVAIYRDQLEEIDRDLAGGAIADSEAAGARTEIARRLIKAGTAPDAPPARSAAVLRLATVAVVAAPVAALGLYLLLGSPNQPGEPLAARPEVQQAQDIATMIAAVEAHLAAAPDDGAGWEVIAPVYARIGRYDDAVTAYGNTIRLLGATAERELALGDAMVRANGGTIPPEAVAAFERSRDLAPDDPRPRFYLALALGQSGERDAAIAAWRDLIASAPAGAEWVPIAQQELAKLEAAPARGPTAADVETASGMTPEDRNTMIEGMVASLAARLADEPGDADGWAQLIRSYMVLGRPDDAGAALARARAAFFSDPARLATVNAAAKDAGLEPTTE